MPSQQWYDEYDWHDPFEDYEPLCSVCGGECANGEECAYNVEQERQHKQRHVERLAAIESANINRITGVGGKE